MGEWVFLAATFDFDDGTMALYRDGEPLDGFYTLPGDPWGVIGDPEPDLASATDPRGIKLGGSYPQNTNETNPCNCRMDGLMFLDRAVSAQEVRSQYAKATSERGAGPHRARRPRGGRARERRRTRLPQLEPRGLRDGRADRPVRIGRPAVEDAPFLGGHVPPTDRSDRGRCRVRREVPLQVT